MHEGGRTSCIGQRIRQFSGCQLKLNNEMEIIHKAALALMVLLALGTIVTVTNSQTNQPPCSEPEASQFDFWLGTWIGEWKDTEGKTQTATNIITKGFDGCVVEENFSTDDKTFIGRSLSMYSANKKIWQQTWVDNTGSYLDFTGGIDGENMILQRKATAKSGKEVLQRMIFTDIKKDSFTWNWESSSDNGATWSLNWQILYRRK